jgi:O-antigen/teichoic acid export membrane protein
VIRRALQAHTVFRVVTLLLTFGFQIIVVKMLTPASYVTYALLLATMLVGERLLSFGIGRTILRFVPRLLSRQDSGGIRVLALRLGALRAAGLVLFLLALIASTVLHFGITPDPLTSTTLIAFGAWFIAYTLLTDANAVAQSLIAHRAAAVAAAGEAFLRIACLTAVYAAGRSITVENVVVISAVAMSVAFAGLLWSIRLTVRHSEGLAPTAPVPAEGPANAAHSEMFAFAGAAYASTLSYQISSPGVIRLVATAGLGVLDLAAYSFAQGLSMALQRALPGMLILPSLEPVAAQMVESGGGDRIVPALSVLFKFELTCALSVIIVMASAGEPITRLISRADYAPYYYILPVLILGLLLSTLYRMLEILGSMNMMYQIFLTMWPLSLAAVAALYLTVGRWGLLSVLVVPTVEIAVRDGILLFTFRHHGVRKALDPARSLRLVLSAVAVLACSGAVILRCGGRCPNVHLVVAVGGVMVFLSTLWFIRPLSALEGSTLSGAMPASWRLPRHLAQSLSEP